MRILQRGYVTKRFVGNGNGSQGNGDKGWTTQLLSSWKDKSTSRLTSLRPFKGRWGTLKANLNFQKNVVKYGILCGVVSTVVLTLYTTLAMKLQAQEMVKNDLDIKIKRCEVKDMSKT